ncbi:MAG: class I SAM-dependent methyltransferase [Rhodospirillales bacterium]|nr:class I SAM-dependent methyltransferase [Rhodospirillales bacterium]
MSLNYDYIVLLAGRLHPGPIKLLDYGCGAGTIVQKAVDAGMDAYGTDLFYEGGREEEQASQRGLLDSRIFRLGAGGIIPFDDKCFDIVVSNQVFEHIDDFRVPIQEIHRVLRRDGLLINLFPSRDVWREGHIGIPLAHRLPQGSWFRFYFTWALRALGLGYFKEGKPLNEWTQHSLSWIDRWTFYKDMDDIRHAFSGKFTIESYNADWLLFRIGRHPKLAWASGPASAAVMRPVLDYACRKLAGMVFVMRKRSER